MQNKTLGLVLRLFNVKTKVPLSNYIDCFVFCILTLRRKYSMHFTKILMKEKAKY